MEIRRLTARLFESGGPCLHDERHSPVERSRLRAEYLGLRRWLLESLAPGEPVAVALERDYRYVLAILACFETGTPWVPLSLGWGAERVGEARRLIGFSRVVDAEVFSAASRSAAGGETLRPVSPEDPLYIICTSGSTGAPKPAIIPRRAFENFLRNFSRDHAFTRETHKHLLLADFTWDMSLNDIALLLTRRPAFYFSRFRADVFELAHEIESLGINSFYSVPNNAGLLLRDEVRRRADLSSLSSLILGGAPLTERVYGDLFKHLSPGLRVFHMYGPTETTIFTHSRLMTGDPAHDFCGPVASVGRPLPGVACLLEDESGRAVSSPDTPGEVLIAGAQVMVGYAGSEAATRSALVERDSTLYYRSQDLAFVDRRGEYYIVGRTGDTLKRRGYRVTLSGIDARVRGLEAVEDCVTLAFPDPERNNVIISCVIPRRRISEAEFRDALSRTLLPHEIPDRVEFWDKFPLSETGKVCRTTLVRQLEARGPGHA